MLFVDPTAKKGLPTADGSSGGGGGVGGMIAGGGVVDDSQGGVDDSEIGIPDGEWNRYILTEEEQKKRYSGSHDINAVIRNDHPNYANYSFVYHPFNLSHIQTISLSINQSILPHTLLYHLHQYRSIIWEKTFRPFMNERELRKAVRERDLQGTNNERYTQSGKLRKKYARREASAANADGTTTSQAVLNLQANNVSDRLIVYCICISLYIFIHVYLSMLVHAYVSNNGVIMQYLTQLM